jgi:cyanophycinase
MKAKGKLMLIGGNVDKGSELEEKDESAESIRFFQLGILERIITELKGDCSRIEIICTASHIPEEVGHEYVNAFHKISCGNIALLPIGIDMDPNSPEVIQRIRESDGLMFTGGDQVRLVEKLGNTKAIREIRSRYLHDENFLVSGTSAGAMALGQLMIEKGRSSQALVKGNVSLGPGFGFLDELLIDTHFVQRGRFGRLIEVIAAKPRLLGIGLGEDTAVLLKNEILETVGTNLVSIIDGKHIRKNNYQEIAPGEPICIDNIGVHILATNHQFALANRRVL